MTASDVTSTVSIRKAPLRRRDHEDDFRAEMRVWVKRLPEFSSALGRALFMQIVNDVDKGGFTWQSAATLAQITRISLRTVRYHLAAFKQAGLIRCWRRTRPDGSFTSTLLYLNFQEPDPITLANRIYGLEGQATRPYDPDFVRGDVGEGSCCTAGDAAFALLDPPTMISQNKAKAIARANGESQERANEKREVEQVKALAEAITDDEQVRKIITHFLKAREASFPNDSSMPAPMMTLKTQAQQWVDAGVPAELACEVIDRGLARAAAGSITRSAPTSLNFFRNSMQDALRQYQTASAKMPETASTADRVGATLNPKPERPRSPREIEMDDWRRKIDGWVNRGFWTAIYGSRPDEYSHRTGEYQCDCPREILAEFGIDPAVRETTRKGRGMEHVA